MCQLESLAVAVNEHTLSLVKSWHDSEVHATTACATRGINIPPLDRAGEHARNRLITTLRELERMVLGPKDALQNMYFRSSETGVIQALCALQVPQNVPLYGCISYDDLASTLKLNKDRLTHLVRNAITCSDYLAETHDGKVKHSAMSAIWHLDPTMANGMEVMMDNLPLSSFHIAQCVQKDPLDHDDSVCAFSVARDKPLFQWFEDNPDQGRKFAAHMRAQSSEGGDEAVRNGYDWSKLAGTTLVDLGGSFGSVGAAILSKEPNMKVIVQDLPKVIDSAKAAAAKAVTPLPKNLSFAAHSFLNPQPVIANVYLYRMVFHNWSDAGARRILEALKPALRPGTRVILIEYVMPKMGSAPPYAELQTRRLDNVMYTLMNGKVRELEEFQTLFAEVEPRLKFNHFKPGQPKATHDPRSHSIMEWIYEEVDAVAEEDRSNHMTMSDSNVAATNNSNHANALNKYHLLNGNSAENENLFKDQTNITLTQIPGPGTTTTTA